MNIGKTGRSGEDRVCAFLRKNGYTVVKRNYQCRYGEIDIIAEKDEYIVFIEVKTRKEDTAVPIFDAVDLKKQDRLRLTANDYIRKTEASLQPRFDTALVSVGDDEKYRLHYIKNAF